MNTCIWCGRRYGSGEGYGAFCGERCAIDHGSHHYRHEEEDEEHQIMKKLGVLLEIECEKIRKADPKQWYGSEWVEHLLEYPEDAEKCNKWNEIDAEHWIMLLKRRKEFISKCSLDQLVDVLLVDISFKKLCEFPRFNAKQVSRLVTKYPQWVNEFSNPIFRNELEKLKSEVIIPQMSSSKNGKLNELSFVITGSLNSFENREQMIEFIEQNSGKVVKAISNKVNYLINKDINSSSAKNIKAKELGIKIISEEDLLEMVNNNWEVNYLE